MAVLPSLSTALMSSSCFLTPPPATSGAPGDPRPSLAPPPPAPLPEVAFAHTSDEKDAALASTGCIGWNIWESRNPPPPKVGEVVEVGVVGRQYWRRKFTTAWWPMLAATCSTVAPVVGCRLRMSPPLWSSQNSNIFKKFPLYTSLTLRNLYNPLKIPIKHHWFIENYRNVS